MQRTATKTVQGYIDLEGPYEVIELQKSTIVKFQRRQMMYSEQ